MPCKNILVRFISVFCKNKWPPGRPNYTVTNSLINNIIKIVPSVKDDGSFNSLARIANNELLWFILINNIGRKNSQLSDYNLE